MDWRPTLTSWAALETRAQPAQTRFMNSGSPVERTFTAGSQLPGGAGCRPRRVAHSEVRPHTAAGDVRLTRPAASGVGWRFALASPRHATLRTERSNGREAVAHARRPSKQKRRPEAPCFLTASSSLCTPYPPRRRWAGRAATRSPQKGTLPRWRTATAATRSRNSIISFLNETPR